MSLNPKPQTPNSLQFSVGKHWFWAPGGEANNIMSFASGIIIRYQCTSVMKNGSLYSGTCSPWRNLSIFFNL